MWKFKNSHFKSQVASTAVDWMINETTAYDKIPLITVWHCNVYLTFKILIKLCFSLWIARISRNVDTVSLFAQLTVASIRQIFGVPVMDSLQHEAYDEIYGIDAFYDH